MDLLQIKGKYDIQIVKLRDIAGKVTQKNSACLVSETFTNSAEKGIISQEDYFERTITNDKNISGYYIVNPDDFVYNPRVSTLAPVGPINRNKLGRTGVISPLYLVFRVHNVEPGYLEWYFKSNAWHNFMLENGNTGARSDRFSISDTEFFSMPIPLPPMNVQKIIANTLDTLEIKINYAKVEAEKLRNFKSSMLSKMFPKEGEKVPEIRFEGFTDDWEQRKLGEVTTYRRGSFPQPYGKSEWYDGDGAMPFVQVADVSDEMNLVEDTKQKISILAQPMSVFAEKNSVLVTLQGSIGRVAITQYGAFVDRTVLIFEKYKDEIDKIFWAYIIKQKFIDEAQKAPGGTIKTITKEALSDFDLSIPNYQEQKQIGLYFRKLDNLITLHQRKYEKLLDVKKAMLSKLIGGAN